MAGDLLNLYAERQVRDWTRRSPTAAQIAFEAAFPYRETPDQSRAGSTRQAGMSSERQWTG